MTDTTNSTAKSNVIDIKTAFAKAKPKAAAQTKKDLAKGTTKAKTATTPAGKQKIAEKIKQKAKAKSRLSAPSELARCRAIVGGDVLAGMLLYRLAYLYRTINPKLKRNGHEYLALSRDDLATSAGLSPSELKNRALPRVKMYASEIISIRAMGNGEDKKMWFTVDLLAYGEALNESGYEIKVAANEGGAPFA